MEAYAQALVIAIPFFILLIGIEALAAWRMGLSINRGADMISSLSSGITNVIKDVLGLTVVIISYAWLVDHIAVVSIQATWAVYLVAFIVLDFAGYWMHRLEHEVNVFWNRHIIHHSSEEFNLSCALRQSVSNVTSFIALFMIPAALLGVPAQVIGFIAPIHLFAQFWYHTRLIGKMGVLEAVLVTPSHHRVHHAMNDRYLDRNYGQILIIWDKLFGTFQPELAAEPPVYGVKRPVRTWNPLLINVQHLWLLIRDAWRTRSWWDKVRIWFMPTGWRPADVAQRYPVDQVDSPDQLQKYDSHPGQALLLWAWTQLGLTLALMFWLFLRIGELPFSQILLYGLFLVVSVFSYTTALDRSRWSVVVEVLKVAFGISMIGVQGGGWFGLESSLPMAGWSLAGVWVMFLAGLVWLRSTPPGSRQPEFQTGSPVK
ncbi:MAG: sterol desaturase family protein [Lewinellaceae bacterium]|nr:sterol desaturase family protein [Lewinellaceae bacterium]